MAKQSKLKKKETLAPLAFKATFAAETADPNARTVELTFYSGAPVFRVPMFGEPYELEFDVSKKAADLSRLNGGASLLDSHQEYSGVGAILGVVERAWLEDGVARAEVRFSKRDEADAVFQDVLDGVIRNVSMGTYILELEDVTEEGAALTRMRATKWEPYELSLVSIPADPGAQVLSLSDADGRPCSIIQRAEAGAEAHNERGNPMKDIKVRLLADCEDGKKGDIVKIDKAKFNAEMHSEELEAQPAPPPATPPAPSGSQLEADSRTIDESLTADKKRKEHLKRIASHYGMDEVWVQRQHNLGVSAEDAVSSATAERAKLSPGGSGIGFGDDHDSAEAKVDRMAEALASRARGQAPSEAARPFAGMSLADLALECLSNRGQGRNLDARRDVAELMSSSLALHTTSDFPLLLANSLNKMLLPEYSQAEPSYRRLAEEKPFNDFRPHNFLRSGDFPNLLEVNEHGEFKYGTIGEGNEPVTAATYGRVVGLSRQTLINDDVSAFGTLATKAARRIADFENQLFFSTCISAGAGLGPDLSDTDPVFDANHSNITAGGALSNTLLESAFALMMNQRSLDGLKLNLMPSIILVSPTNWGAARRLVADINPTQASEVNTFAGQLEVVADANLTGTRFYVLANPADLANYVYGYIGGQGPRTEVRAGFEVDGVEFKLALDFGVGAIEYRAGVTGAGA